MFCPQCGAENVDNAAQCVRCGRVFNTPVVSGSVIAPVHVSNHLVFAILSTIFCCLPAGIVGIVYAAQVNSKLQAGDVAGAQRASQNAKIWSWVSVGLGLFMVLFWAAIAIPNLLRARMVANETSAVSTVKTLVAAERNFARSNPQTGYTCSLSDLQQAGLISQQAASGTLRGYQFQLHACFGESAGGPNTEFKVDASPVKLNNTGRYSYCSDQTGVMRRGNSFSDCVNGAPVNGMSSVQSE